MLGKEDQLRTRESKARRNYASGRCPRLSIAQELDALVGCRSSGSWFGPRVSDPGSGRGGGMAEKGARPEVAVSRPSKPIREMTDAERRQYAEKLYKAFTDARRRA